MTERMSRHGADPERSMGAHPTAGVAVPPPREPDARIWRVVGDPLLPATGSGRLDGHTVAVKDVFAVEGFAVGAGVPAYLEEAAPNTRSAASLRALQAAGAAVRGIARTDQFAYSIAGRNSAYGTPPNPAVPGSIPGGSSSGPASAVAMGHASIGLATDTAGSIRVPASYQGLWGLRTTHGAVSMEGVLPLAPSFDTVGWLARDRATLEAVTAVSLDAPAQVRLGDRFVTASALATSATSGVAAAFVAYLEVWDREVTAVEDESLSDAALDSVQTALRTVQAVEAWTAHGAWVTAHPGALGADVAARFEWAAAITPHEAAASRRALDGARCALDAALGDAVLVLPSAASVAPALDAADDEIEAVRAATLRMTAVAGATGRPALSVPALSVDGAPVGVCFVGPRGSDLALVRAAEDWLPQAKRR